MDLYEALSFILNRYGSAKKESFADHPVAAFLRRTARDCVASLLRDIFDRFITTTAQEGFYITGIP